MLIIPAQAGERQSWPLVGFVLAFIMVLLAPAAAWAAASPWVGDARGAARLITATEATGSANRLDAALQLRLAPGWHTYWRTPGDAGFPATIDWSGSENVAKAEIAWPAPSRLTIEGLENYVYVNQAVLPLTLTVMRPGEPVRLRAAVDYASCDTICIPYHATLSLDLPAGLATPGPEASLIARAAVAVPGALGQVGLRLASATVSDAVQGRTLAVQVASEAGPLRAPDLFVEGTPFNLPAPRVTLGAAGRTATLAVLLPPDAAGMAVGQNLTFTVVDGARAAEFAATPLAGPPPESGRGALLTILGAALLGGLVLNAMPCVLPVVSLKLLSVAAYAGAERRRVRLGLAATAAGVIVSFLVIAGALAGLKLAGASVGWGIQFQQPWFLAAMAVATTLFAASLWELLPIGLPGFAAAAGNVRSRHATLDAFIAGAFATLLATSCSAPFVGTAVGFALARGPAEIMLVFAALGLGMAAPLLLVAAMPGLARVLPRPGPWMIVLRRMLGLALAGTAVWLLWVLAQVVGAVPAAIAGAALVGLVAVLHQTGRGGGAGRRRAVAGLAVAMVAVAVLAPSLVARPLGSLARDGAQWQVFNLEAIRREVALGNTVFVDVTAAWCLTCKVNEAAVLDRSPVAERLRTPGVVAMRADWTRPEPQVTGFMQTFGRYGVPLAVVYGPGQPDGEPLPELLTSAVVLDAITRAAGPAQTNATPPGRASRGAT